MNRFSGRNRYLTQCFMNTLYNLELSDHVIRWNQMTNTFDVVLFDVG